MARGGRDIGSFEKKERKKLINDYWLMGWVRLYFSIPNSIDLIWIRDLSFELLKMAREEKKVSNLFIISTKNVPRTFKILPFSF